MSGDSLLIPWYTLALPLTPRYTPKILSYSYYSLLHSVTHLLHPDASCYSLLQPRQVPRLTSEVSKEWVVGT